MHSTQVELLLFLLFKHPFLVIPNTSHIYSETAESRPKRPTMLSLVALSSLLLPLASAMPCVQFDTAWNLYAFGGSEDVNLGQSSSWGCECRIHLA